MTLTTRARLFFSLSRFAQAVRPSPLDDEVLWDEVLLDEACVWVRCERLRRSLHLCGCAALVAVPLLLALGSGLVTLATRKLAAPLGLLKAPLTASSAVLLALLAPALLASLLMATSTHSVFRLFLSFSFFSSSVRDSGTDQGHFRVRARRRATPLHSKRTFIYSQGPSIVVRCS